jgi:glycosyltransferase involved in cell wall biosynthesis
VNGNQEPFPGRGALHLLVRSRDPVARILFVYSRESSFISIDREILRKRWEVRDWRQGSPLVNLPALIRAVRRSDVVFGWFASWQTFWPVTLAWLFRTPSVLVVGGYDSARMPEIGYGLQHRAIHGRISRFAMRRASRLVANSHYAQREIEANVGIAPGQVTVVHHGVPDPFGALPAGPRERLALTVGVVDRPNLERKGLRPFVEAAARLPDVSFILAGAFADESADELRAIGGPNVILTGWIDQQRLEDTFRRAAVYVQASRHEGFGLSLAEAMLAGCIPVTTTAGALPEVVGDTGVVVAAPTPDEIATGVERALALGDEARAAVRARIVEQFPLSARAEGLESVVEQALGRKGH